MLLGDHAIDHDGWIASTKVVRPPWVVQGGLGAGTLAFASMEGIGRSGSLSIGGKVVDTHTMEHTIPLILAWDENLDVGSDTGTPVDDADYQVPFAFSGKIGKITLDIDRPKLSAADIAKLKEAMAKAADGPSAGTPPK